MAAKDDILRRLPSAGGRTVRELATAVGLSPSALRQHLASLEREGLVEKMAVRGRPGRPAFAYRRAEPSAGPADPSRFLGVLLRVVESLGPDRAAEVVDGVVGALESEYRAIEQIPDPGARIRAAVSVLFDGEGRSQVRIATDGYEVSLRRCPLLPAARESPACCEIARRLLARLSRAEVEQRESLLRGDPRCLFLLRVPAAGGRMAKAG
ncbi:MAG: ArsR family transcriptional regulator [Armatimonadota bacterium]|nr:ArsR family transcriptional regulator [Armatimonadota bacterium]MDR7561643.1 ArsR family transcriptional regulator [Armatimonadota bacterium]MDR7588967.1 ArsR family transcriptional regulator [Armatimonadota bacterium]MDR7612464.1 ArsR family transcriptional regulator [Armatimonadota bacterium]